MERRAFLREYVLTNGLDGKVSVLSSSVGDDELARFYAHAEFTIYPSNYEGWGLPVSESLAFGKVPVVARQLLAAVKPVAISRSTSEPVISTPSCTRSRPTPWIMIDAANSPNGSAPASAVDLTWEDVARTIAAEIDAAERRDPVFPTIELGREYMLAVGQPAPDEGYADQYLDHLVREGLTPMLRQPRGERDFEITDAAVIGTFGSPQTWGNEIRPGRYAAVLLHPPGRWPAGAAGCHPRDAR